MTVFSKSWETVPRPVGSALISMLHRTLHGCHIITHKHCIFVHLQPSPFPRIRHPPICSQYLCVQCLFFPCDMYMRASLISFLCEFLTREPHQSPDRTLPWIPCKARMKPALEGGHRSAIRSHVSHSSLLRMDPSQPKLGLGMRCRRMGVLIGWVCPEFPCSGR